MNLRKTAIFYFLFSLLFSIESYSQVFRKGYIISNIGDTASGYVVSPLEAGGAGVCYFKQEPNSDPVGFSAKELLELGFDNKKFVATNFNFPKDTIIFTQLIYNARTQLRYIELFSNKFFIVVKPDQSTSIIRYPPELTRWDIFSGRTQERKFKEQTDSIFLDTPDLPEYQNGVKPEIESFLSLFEQYYNTSAVIVKSPANKISTELKKGFIINKTNDTIEGFIGNSLKRSIFNACYFTPNKKENMIRFLPDDIKGFGTFKGNEIFISTKFKIKERDTTAFVRLFFDGNLDLLFYETNDKDIFLIRDLQNRTYEISYPPELSKDDYLEGLNASRKFNLITDSIFSVFSIQRKDKIKPSANSFIAILKEYHHTSGKSYKILSKPERIFEIGPITGVKFEKYQEGTLNNDFKSFFELAPYGGFYIKNIDSRSKFGFVLGNTLSYNRNKYSSKINNIDHSVFSQTSITTLAYNADAGLTFNPLKKSFPFNYIDVGGAFRYHINPVYETLTNKVYNDNSVMSYIDNDIKDSKFFYGGFLRVGVTKYLNNNNISIAGGYYYLTSNSSTTIHSFDIFLIYTIRFR